MSEEQPDRPGAEDPSDAAVRRLLASARETGTVPDDVAARLDATLASLTADRRGAAAAGDAPASGVPAVGVPASADEPDRVVTPLRRRSPIGQRLLVAAAAVAVIGGGGYGLSQLPSSSSGSSDSAPAAGGRAGSDAASTASEPEVAPLVPGSETPASGAVPDATAATVLPTFTRAGFADQAARYAADPSAGLTKLSDPVDGRTSGESPGAGATRSPAPTTPGVDDLAGASTDLYLQRAAKVCPGPAVADGTSRPVLLDGRTAALVVHDAAADGSRLLEAWSCDGKSVLASTTVPR